MYRAEEVQPKKWNDIQVIYDDGTYSAVWGYYGGQEQKSLGVRWNGGERDNGYPNQGRYPLWYVEPELVTKTILLQFQDLVRSQPHSDLRSEYLNNIGIALREFREL